MRYARASHSNRPNRRIPASRAVALQRPAPSLGLGREWLTALVAVSLLVAALFST